MIEIREKPLRQTVMARNLYQLGLVKYVDVQFPSLLIAKKSREGEARKELGVSIYTSRAV
jgi:hypothetical protein